MKRNFSIEEKMSAERSLPLMPTKVIKFFQTTKEKAENHIKSSR
jgi:hypothetical protein